MNEMTPAEILVKQQDTLAKIRAGVEIAWLPDTSRREVATSLEESIKAAEPKLPRPLP